MSTPSTRPERGPGPRLRRRVAAVAALALGTVTAVTSAGNTPASATSHLASGLPAGWELCILQGLGAHATAANLSDLDTWQVAEGGGTENGVAYNPFNTRRGTDQSGAAVPASYTANGFPVFASWTAGCAATVATILQPNMAPIASALGTGTVAPASTFLTDVNQTPWCAPSDGVPCYADLIAGGMSVNGSDAVTMLHSASDAVSTYDRDTATESVLQATLSADRQQLATAEAEVQLARFTLQHATDVLRSLAIYDYTSNPSLDHMASLLGRFHPPSQTDMLSQYYLGLDAQSEVGRYQRAQTLLGQAQATRVAATATVARTTTALAGATRETGRAQSSLQGRLLALRDAGACTGDPGTPAPPATAPAVTAAPATGPDAVATLRGCLATLEA